MYIKEFLERFKGDKIRLFVDMDGVIADYDVGFPSGYDQKRPLVSNISKLEEISKMDNIELFILSISRMHEGIEQKNNWLDRYAPFFKKENRVIIAREDNNFEHSDILKQNYVQNIQRDESKIILIDDDPAVLKAIRAKNEDVTLLKDTALVD